MLYCAIGVEIVKRKRALRAVSSDSIPLDSIVSKDTVSFDNPSNFVTPTEEEFEPRPRHSMRLSHRDEPVSLG